MEEKRKAFLAVSQELERRVAARRAEDEIQYENQDILRKEREISWQCVEMWQRELQVAAREESFE